MIVENNNKANKIFFYKDAIYNKNPIHISKIYDYSKNSEFSWESRKLSGPELFENKFQLNYSQKIEEPYNIKFNGKKKI